MTQELITPVRSNGHVTRCAFGEQWVYLLMVPRFTFCYAERLDPARLKAALARVITDYGAFSGRLVYRDRSWHLEHGLGGVLFEVVQSTETSAALGVAAQKRSTDLLCAPLSPFRAMRGKGPVFAARLTQTADGSAIGVTWNHIVGDAHSAMLLVKAWSLAYRDLPYDKPLEVSDVDQFLIEHIPCTSGAQRRRRMLSWWQYLRLVLYMLCQPARRVIHEFSWADLGAIQQVASRSMPVSIPIALCAHIGATVRRLRNRATSSTLALVVDYRKRLGLPANLLGNVLDLVGTTVTNDDDTALIAHRLKERVDNFARGPSIHHEMMEYKAARLGALKLMRFTDHFFDPLRGNLILTTPVRAGLYDIVFESAKPLFACARGSEQAGPHWHGTVSESAGNAGLTLELWLPSRLARRLESEMSRPYSAVLKDNAAQTVHTHLESSSVE